MMREDLWQTVREHAPEGTSWLEEQIADIHNEPSSIVRPFAAAGRKVGHQLLDPDAGQYAWTVDDAARVLLLLAAGQSAWNHVVDLYRYGDTAERRGVLRSLSMLPPSDAGMSVVHDALRSNEPILIVSAFSEYSLTRFTDEEVNQAVLKCVFLEIPLDVIDGLFERTNADLAQMLAHLARERVAAGRDVSADIWPLVLKHPPARELEAIESDLRSPVESRREAASRALEALRSARERKEEQG